MPIIFSCVGPWRKTKTFFPFVFINCTSFPFVKVYRLISHIQISKSGIGESEPNRATERRKIEREKVRGSEGRGELGRPNGWLKLKDEMCCMCLCDVSCKAVEMGWNERDRISYFYSFFSIYLFFLFYFFISNRLIFGENLYMLADWLCWAVLCVTLARATHAGVYDA